MNIRTICEGVDFLGAVDWNRRLFDALIPLPDGTSYNAYLVRGTRKTALLDTVDPAQTHVLMEQLADVPQVDYVISHHAEQDHSGSIPAVLAKYPQAQVVTNPKCRDMLIDLLGLSMDRFRLVQDGETLDLGGKTLEFLYTPWVHWPETMCTYLPEDRILFSCDFFGAHLATSDLYVADPARGLEAAKRYYAEIMMPFRQPIRRNLDRVQQRDIRLIGPSHGPVYNQPQFILDAYRDWAADAVKNEVVLPYVSMHGSTQKMVEHFTAALVTRGVRVHPFDLTVTDLGKLAIALVDAATLVIAAPTVHIAPHPLAFYAAHVANALRPKLRHAAFVGSFGWSTKAPEQVAGLLPNLKAEILPPVLSRGQPGADTFARLDDLAGAIAERHAKL